MIEKILLLGILFLSLVVIHILWKFYLPGLTGSLAGTSAHKEGFQASGGTYTLPVQRMALDDMTVARVRIDGGGDWLNFERIRFFAFNGTNVNNTVTATAASIASPNDKPEITLLSTDDGSIYHSGDMFNQWVQYEFKTPIKLDRIEIVNRRHICCAYRLAHYTLRVYDILGNEFFTQKLTSAFTQTYGMPGYKFPPDCTPWGGRDLRCNSMKCNGQDIKLNGNTCLRADAPEAKGLQQKMIFVLTGPADRDGNGTIWVSDKGTPQLPIWNQTSGAADQATGRESRLFVVNSADNIYSTTTGTGLKDGSWTNIPGKLRQVSRDRLAVCGTNSGNNIYCAYKDIEFKNSWEYIGGNCKWVSIYNNRMLTVATNNYMYYMNTIKTTDGAQNIHFGTNIHSRRAKMAVLGEINPGAMGAAMMDEEGLIYVIDLRNNIGGDGKLTGTLRWFQLDTVGGTKARYIHMNMGRLIYIATNNKIYYTEDYRAPNWVEVRPPPADEVFAYGSGYNHTKGESDALCKSIGARLASSLELEKAYEGGANWCAWGWVSDGMPRFPNTKDAVPSCNINGDAKTGIVIGSAGDHGKFYATCYGPKPAKPAVEPPGGTVRALGFNGDNWNAPYQSIELVSFSTVDPVCGEEGMIGTFQGQRYRYYSRDECETIGARMSSKDKNTTEYNAATGECRVAFSGKYECNHYNAQELARIQRGESHESVCESVPGRIWTGGDESKAPGCYQGCGCCKPVNPNTRPPKSLSTEICVNVQDRPNQDPTKFWDDGSTGNCIFNPIEYQKKYLRNPNDPTKFLGDLGDAYTHWITKGLPGGFSPCGDINPACRWDPDAYYEKNPSARGKEPRNAMEHYKQIGIKQGLKFCDSTGIYPLMDALKSIGQPKRVIDEAAIPIRLRNECKSQPVATPTPAFQKEEVFFVRAADIGRGAAATTCASVGARVAKFQELKNAQTNGATWCDLGWLQDHDEPHYTVGAVGQCGVFLPGVYEDSRVEKPTTAAGATCYGIKPARGKIATVAPFSQAAWSQFGATADKAPMKRWTCSNRAFAEEMFKGPGGADTVYLSDADSVCFTDDAASKQYFCRSMQEYKNGDDYTAQLSESYEESCNRMVQALVDLSGAINTVRNIEGGIKNGANSIGGAALTLDKVFNTLKCDNPPAESVTLCKVVEVSRNNVLKSRDQISSTDPNKPGLYNAVLDPISAAEASRTAILGTIKNLQCPL